MEGGTLVIWILYILIHVYAASGSDGKPRLSPETEAYRERLRQERERKRLRSERQLIERARKRLEAQRREEVAAEQAKEHARLREQRAIEVKEEARLRVQRAREEREEAEREALEAELVVFESANDAFPELPSVSLHEDEPLQAEAVAAS